MADSPTPSDTSDPPSPPPGPAAPPVATIPPTVRPEYQRPNQSSWPMVLGILCAVFGILGALSGMCGVFGSFMQIFFAGAIENNPEAGEMAAVMKRMLPFTLAGVTVNMILSIVLATGGFGLTARRRWGRTVLLHWSWLRMLAVVLGVVSGFMMQQAMAEAVEHSAANSGQTTPGGMSMTMMMGLFGSLGLVISLIWGWALPIFNLIWLNRSAIRNEVQSWP